MFQDIFADGSETAAVTLEWPMAELLRNQRVMYKAQAEVQRVFEGKRRIEETDIHKLDHLKLVVKETLRLHPPAPLVPRESRERYEIFGYEVPEKAKVIVNVWAIGRDPDIWSNADCFQPERFIGSSFVFKGTNFKFLPFGAGSRMCPGISFASANIELALAQMLYHFHWKLANGTKPDELELIESFGGTSRMGNDLYAIATPFVPSIL